MTVQAAGSINLPHLGLPHLSRAGGFRFLALTIYWAWLRRDKSAAVSGRRRRSHFPPSRRNALIGGDRLSSDFGSRRNAGYLAGNALAESRDVVAIDYPWTYWSLHRVPEHPCFTLMRVAFWLDQSTRTRAHFEAAIVAARVTDGAEGSHPHRNSMIKRIRHPIEKEHRVGYANTVAANRFDVW